MESPKKKVIILSCKEMVGDGEDPSTMDYRTGKYQVHMISVVIPGMRSRGIDVTALDWTVLTEDRIASSDSVLYLLGPVWDYHKKPEQFRKMLEWFQLHPKTRLVNPVDMVIWNMDKRYLGDLEKMGIDIPKTIFIESALEVTWTDIKKRFAAEVGPDTDMVLKPCIGGDGDHFSHLKIIPEKDKANEATFAELRKLNRGILVQRYIPEIRRKGEMGFVFFQAEYQYVLLKVPKKGSDLANSGPWESIVYEKDITPKLKYIRHKYRPDFALTETDIKLGIEIAKKYIAKYCESRGEKEKLKYARVDGVMSEGKLVIMELELIEPYLDLFDVNGANPSKGFLQKYVNAVTN